MYLKWKSSQKSLSKWNLSQLEMNHLPKLPVLQRRRPRDRKSKTLANASKSQTSTAVH
jgi:hypothetical protein